jgi:hypothetical protein
MAEMNKFSEGERDAGRNGCKSVLNQHKYTTLSRAHNKNAINHISIEPSVGTFDVNNLS